jgi:putative ABC transport system permease protein
MAPKGQNMAGTDQDDTAIIPITTALNRVIGRNPANPSGDLGRSDQGTRRRVGGHIFNEVRQVVRDRHGLLPEQEDNCQLIDMAQVMKAKEDSARALAILLAAIAGVSLLVGGIGIMNIMLVSITERTREIGVRMAVGARRSDILSQFLVESITLSPIGGLAGIGVGIVGAALRE